MPPRDWRVFALLLFWLGLVVTTHFAAMPYQARPMLIEASAAIAPAFLILVLINTREKLFILMVATAAAFALVTLKGGYWAVIHGFADRVYGPPGGHYYDNNYFAVAAVMTIPLLLLWFRQSTDRWLKILLGVLIGLSVLAALSSWSRGGLLALGATATILFMESRKKAWALVPVAFIGLVAVAFFPDHWFERMQSIGAEQLDASAQSRIDVWQRGLDFALGRPLLGSGFDGWVFGGGVLDWHSAYIQILAEHGFVVFAIWCSILVGTFWGLSRLVRHHRHSEHQGWIADYAAAIRAALVAYAVGGLFIGIGYWDLLYNLIALAIVMQGLASKVRATVTSRKANP